MAEPAPEERAVGATSQHVVEEHVERPVRWEVHLIRALVVMPDGEVEQLMSCMHDKIVAALKDPDVVGQLDKAEIARLLALLVR